MSFNQVLEEKLYGKRCGESFIRKSFSSDCYCVYAWVHEKVWSLSQRGLRPSRLTPLKCLKLRLRKISSSSIHASLFFPAHAALHYFQKKNCFILYSGAGLCLESFGVKAGDTRDHLKRGRFFPFTPQFHLMPYNEPGHWYWKWTYYPTQNVRKNISFFLFFSISIGPRMCQFF